ncbi:M48 family metalloprotease [Kitasatospora sp. NPDC036755]|uniref:M48 family metalloprotease n=1 Tax=Kitasatospora sp. NPDC036755 TaxID=3154600 RepID=UPI0033CE2035
MTDVPAEATPDAREAPEVPGPPGPPEAAPRPAPAAPDERVLAAGTTLRFVLLLLLLAAAGVDMVPRTVWQLLASSPQADKEMACQLAAGFDPGASVNSGLVQSTRNASALKACTARYVQNFDGVSVTVGVLLVVAVLALYWLLPVWKARRTRVVAVAELDPTGRLRQQLDELVRTAGLARAPRFVVDPVVPEVGAVVFGRWRSPTVCLYGGLFATSGTDRDRFRAVVLHELAHLRNKDVGITYATVALWRVFLLLVLLPWAAVGVKNLFFTGTADARGHFAPFNTHQLVLGLLIVVAVHLTRAGILRNREIYADLMAARWGASRESWSVTAAPRAGRGLPRALAGFVELWRTHPSWELRRASLTDPKALFALDALPLFLTGLAADILVWQLGSLPFDALPAKAVLIAALVVGIGGVAVWRAAVYAVLTGRRTPTGWPAGLWLGTGLVAGELLGPRAALNHWWPAHPEALLILVAALVLVMAWTAQNAGWWIASWRGRSLRPVMLVGLAAASLALGCVLYWWYTQGEALTAGWPFTTAGLLGAYGLPGLPPAHIGPLLEAIAVLGVLPGALTAAHSLWWAVALLWLLPLLALAAGRPTGRPKWLARALPGGLSGGPLGADVPPPAAGPPAVGDAQPEPAAVPEPPVPLGPSAPAGPAAPPPPSPARPGRLMAAGLAGGLLCWAGLAAAKAHLHTPSPAAVRSSGPFQVTYLMGPVLVLGAAMALTAAVVAAVARSSWLLAGLVTAGVTALVGTVGSFLLMSADGCVGPFNVMTHVCGWRPEVVWRLLQIETAFALTLGTLLAGLAAFAGRGAGLLWRRRGRAGRCAAVPVAGPGPHRRTRRHAVRAVAGAVVVAGVAATVVIAVQLPGPRGGGGRGGESMLDQRTTAPSPAIALAQRQAWAAVGGLDHVNGLYTAQRDYAAAIDAVVSTATNGGSEAQVEAAMRKVGDTCDALDGATRQAGGYFTVPDPAGQQLWSRMLAGYRQLTAVCRDLAERPESADPQAAGVAYHSAIDTGGRMVSWLLASGAVRQTAPH